MLSITVALFLRADLEVKSETAKVSCLLQTWGSFEVWCVFWAVWPPTMEWGRKPPGSAALASAWRRARFLHVPEACAGCLVPFKAAVPWERGGTEGESMLSPGRGFSTCRYSRIWLRFGDWGICVTPETFLRKSLTLLKDLGWEIAVK